ncbi:DUF2141 domain-containing protein [Piscinibacter koreensis]|uniref:DUF2141 domain-containing protein n=1 Tax=Piscinibacter koreensis TaxID=2742824 RepID=A0A7Y6TUS0_9BURK|nr:DUF2141 domain-containing protein [Schlegelella koreensis]NUZ04295.1 DUF2141 domain-containing protein [Schlegelella koreensis]
MQARSLTLATALGAALSAATLFSAAPAGAADCAQVEVRNVRPQQGTLMIAAYADAASFDKKPAASLALPAGDATQTFPLCGLTGAEVALTLYQDLNGNGKLDRSLFGMPSEPWGASGKPAAMSAPTWDTTHVPLDASPIVVNLSK